METNEDLAECTRMCIECLFCCWCSQLYYAREEEQSYMQSSCAASHFCLGYGSLTTALSAGACDVSKSSVCLSWIWNYRCGLGSLCMFVFGLSQVWTSM